MSRKQLLALKVDELIAKAREKGIVGADTEGVRALLFALREDLPKPKLESIWTAYATTMPGADPDGLWAPAPSAAAGGGAAPAKQVLTFVDEVEIYSRSSFRVRWSLDRPGIDGRLGGTPVAIRETAGGTRRSRSSRFRPKQRRERGPTGCSRVHQGSLRHAGWRYGCPA